MLDDKKALLSASEERIFSLSLDDTAARLSYQNTKLGLGKILWVLKNHYDGEAFCVLGSDATITRNAKRWWAGFAYGLVLKWWPEGVYFPEVRPNGCGMLVARFDEFKEEELLERVVEVETSELELGGVRLRTDFGEGNHFLEFYELSQASEEVAELFPRGSYYIILHTSSPELKPSVYAKVEECEFLETPLGKLGVLSGSKGEEYYKLWQKYSEFCMKRREFLANQILDGCEVLINECHQGMFQRNEVRLGCHKTEEGKFYPIALRWDKPVYIFKGLENLSLGVIDKLGFRERAERLGLLEELQHINLLPHGGGYEINLRCKEISRIQTKLNGFLLRAKSPIVVLSPGELPFNYRVAGVVEQVLKHKLGTPVVQLKPLLTLKM